MSLDTAKLSDQAIAGWNDTLLLIPSHLAMRIKAGQAFSERSICDGESHPAASEILPRHIWWLTESDGSFDET